MVAELEPIWGSSKSDSCSDGEGRPVSRCDEGVVTSAAVEARERRFLSLDAVASGDGATEGALGVVVEFVSSSLSSLRSGRENDVDPVRDTRTRGGMVAVLVDDDDALANEIDMDANEERGLVFQSPISGSKFVDATHKHLLTLCKFCALPVHPRSSQLQKQLLLAALAGTWSRLLCVSHYFAAFCGRLAPSPLSSPTVERQEIVFVHTYGPPKTCSGANMQVRYFTTERENIRLSKSRRKTGLGQTTVRWINRGGGFELDSQGRGMGIYTRYGYTKDEERKLVEVRFVGQKRADAGQKDVG